MLKKIAKNLLLRYLPKSVALDYNLKNGGENVFFSQEGEDILLERIFAEKGKGFYIDIGAHHPTRFSNTYNSYLKGWSGINIDATPSSMTLFNLMRARDINLEIGIAEKEGEIEYYIMDEPALNTFSRERVDFLITDTNYKLVESKVVKTKTIAQVLNEYLPRDQHIDFLTIDAEGMDFKILQSNDWDKYRPFIILTEEWSGSLEKIFESNIYKLLRAFGYELYAKTVSTIFFRDSVK
jgi:FkbM family methyltransferase